jgi:hypothetical protein
MSLFICTVYSWVDFRDSSNRISKKEATLGRQFILNTNRITNLKAKTVSGHVRSTFQYSEIIGDRRENVSTIICDHTVAQIISHFDDVPSSTAITLPIVPYNQPWGSPKFPLQTPVNTTIARAAIAYVDRYNPDPNNYVWVCYQKGSFKRLEVLCSIDIYPTLTTTTTADQR